MSFKPTEQQLEYIMHYAGECAPREACGVIAGGDFYPVRNLIDDRNTAFLMDPAEYVKVEAAAKAKNSDAKIEAIVHSHVDQPSHASDQDRACCEKLKIPFLIVSYPAGDYTVLEPTGAYKAPLVGRQWGYGTHDCLSLVKDALEEYKGIVMPEYNRGEWQWWRKGGNLIAEHFEDAGFIRLPQGSKPKHLDVFGMSIASKVVNHLGIFLEPDVILHQLQERLSVREVYGGVLQRATVLHLRHKQLL